jgi:hypothetical protein
MYRLISKPKRRSSKDGVLHFMLGILVVGGRVAAYNYSRNASGRNASRRWRVESLAHDKQF